MLQAGTKARQTRRLKSCIVTKSRNKSMIAVGSGRGEAAMYWLTVTARDWSESRHTFAIEVDGFSLAVTHDVGETKGGKKRRKKRYGRLGAKDHAG